MNDWEVRLRWQAYLHARQLYIETGDVDALANMIANVTEHDEVIPDHLDQIAWRTPTGPEVVMVTPADLHCY
jgi:hypothetical protein